MKVINISTSEIIEEYPDSFPEHKFYCGPQYWAEYKKVSEEFGEKFTKRLLYGEEVD